MAGSRDAGEGDLTVRQRHLAGASQACTGFAPEPFLPAAVLSGLASLTLPSKPLPIAVLTLRLQIGRP